ncbi:MAG: holin, BlyA family protein [Pseudobutyrivibrio sp.]|nr:holin, BlyA family protein [Pseudobutyrivibrio sp.]
MNYLMIKQKIKNFLEEEDGIGTVEMILILVVLIGLVLIFKEQLTSLVNAIFKTINERAKSV